MLRKLVARQKPEVTMKRARVGVVVYGTGGQWLGLWNPVVSTISSSPGAQVRSRAHCCLPVQGASLSSYFTTQIRRDPGFPLWMGLRTLPLLCCHKVMTHRSLPIHPNTSLAEGCKGLTFIPKELRFLKKYSKY